MANCITDVDGIAVGHAHDGTLLSGVTVILPDAPVIASVVVPGGAPAGRDLGCLEPDATVQRVDAIVLSGGSGYGLDAASGVQAWLREQGRGFAVGTSIVPIVPAVVCFDLNNGGDKAWGRYPPYRELGHRAAAAASREPFPLGTVGGGYGASTVDLKGGLGSASAVTSGGHTVGAVVVVNALGSALLGDGPHFWAAALEREGEIGGLGLPAGPVAATRLAWKGRAPGDVPLQPSTTIACVATDVRLTKAQARRLAAAASAELARGLRLSQAAMDGDTVLAVSTERRPLEGGVQDLIEIGAVAADCLARAIARAVYEAHVPGPAWRGPPAWRDRFTGHAATALGEP